MSSPLKKAAWMMLILVSLTIISWEVYLRSRGVDISYDEGKELWSDKRAMVYHDTSRATVFIGSSRNKYDLDAELWKELTGECAVQLAIEGNSPLPILDDLAADKKFRGKLIIDVTEGLFFSTSPRNISDPEEKIAYYKKRTPSERFSFEVNRLLESQLVFLDKDNFSLNALLEKTKIPSRPGVFVMPIFPLEFGRVKFSRQDYMTPKFLSDTNLQNKVKDIWVFFAKNSREKPADQHKVDSIVSTVKKDIDKITARGGKVLFVRTPSSGRFLEAEKNIFPREKYWDRLLAGTGTPGIHFLDYPATSNFQCPEFSHLSPADAKIWTRNLVEILQKEKGWIFSKSTSTR